MYDITVKIDRALLRLGKMPDEVRASLKAEADVLATKLRDKSKDKFSEFFQSRTGAFLKSIKKSVRSNKNGVVGKVFSRSKVAHLLERGTRPHDIRSKNAKALAFLGGKFAEVVHHPGIRGHTIINAAFQDMQDEIRSGLSRAVKDGTAAADAAAG